MKRLIAILFVISGLSFAFSFASAIPSLTQSINCDAPIRIMPLGDSITRGRGSSDIGYRKSLFDRLIADGYDVDFVGGLMHGQGFDADHEGHGGQTAGYIATNIYNFLNTTPADVILMHIGTNGLSPEATQVEAILNEIDRWERDNNQEVIIFLARIIDQVPRNPTVTTFNNNVEAMVEARNDRSIVIVDMQNGAGINYANTSAGGDMSDDVHPANPGYEKMAQVWYDALTTFLTNCSTVSILSSPVTEAVVGETYIYEVSAISIPLPTYSLGATFPDGMTINPETGIVSWVPSTSGSFDVTVRAENETTFAEQSFTLEISALDIISFPVLTARIGQPYTYNVEALGDPILGYELVGEFPEDMSIDNETGLISWTPTTEGTFPITVRAINDTGIVEQDFTITTSELIECPANVVSYWKLDETGDTQSFVDEVGTHPGTCTGPGCPLEVEGVVGKARQFDGQNDNIIVNVPNSDTNSDVFDWNSSDGFTIETWFNIPPTSTCGNNELLVGRYGPDTAIWLWCSRDTANIGLYIRDDLRSSAANLKTGIPLNDGRWHHTAAIWDGETEEIRLYIDSVLFGTQSVSFDGDFASDGHIDIASYFSDYYFSGNLDEIVIYNRALLAEEIQAHYNNGRGVNYCTLADR